MCNIRMVEDDVRNCITVDILPKLVTVFFQLVEYVFSLSSTSHIKNLLMKSIKELKSEIVNNNDIFDALN